MVRRVRARSIVVGFIAITTIARERAARSEEIARAIVRKISQVAPRAARHRAGMFHHVQISVSDFGRALRFWRAALEPLGFVAQHVDEASRSAGFGPPGTVRLWIGVGTPSKGPVHLAFEAQDPEAVKRFHAAALAAGGRDHGAPGPRPDYGASYWAAFVLDPDGNNIEPVDAADTPTPDGPSVDGAPSDVDSDGVTNASDNCVDQANPDQHDEDGDLLGDVCDNCPHVANATQANVMEPAGQADAVGDACDPRPTIGGDTIERFIGFQAMPVGVTLTGTWTIAADAAEKPGTGVATLVVGGVRSHVTVEVGGELLTFRQAFSTLHVTVGETAGTYTCGYLDEIFEATPDFHNGVFGQELATGWELLSADNHFLANRLAGAFTIQAGADPTEGRVRCTTTDARGSGIANRAAPQLGPGAVGVRSDGFGYRIEYLIVYGTP